MSRGVTGCLVDHRVLEGCIRRGGVSRFRSLCLCGGTYTDGQTVVSGVDGLEIQCPLTSTPPLDSAVLGLVQVETRVRGNLLVMTSNNLGNRQQS